MKVFIGCSASNVDKKYKDLAVDVSTAIAKRGHKLVFGGFGEGMMGSCYMTFRYEDQKVKGVALLKDISDLQKLELDAHDIVNTTFERTKVLYDSSDLIVILPGGIGTLEEFFCMLDEIRTTNSNKKIILFDYEDFYKPILKFFEKLHKERFVSDIDLKLINIVRDINGLNKCLDLLEGVK